MRRDIFLRAKMLAVGLLFAQLGLVVGLLITSSDGQLKNVWIVLLLGAIILLYIEVSERLYKARLRNAVLLKIRAASGNSNFEK